MWDTGKMNISFNLHTCSYLLKKRSNVKLNPQLEKVHELKSGKIYSSILIY